MSKKLNHSICNKKNVLIHDLNIYWCNKNDKIYNKE